MEVFKPKEFAEKIGVSVSTLQRWDREGILVAQRTPTDRRYYTRSDVENYFRATNISHDGRWVEIFVDKELKHKCSICGAVYDYDDNYCGSCGARMVWDKDEKSVLNSRKELMTDEE